MLKHNTKNSIIIWQETKVDFKMISFGKQVKSNTNNYNDCAQGVYVVVYNWLRNECTFR